MEIKPNLLPMYTYEYEDKGTNVDVRIPIVADVSANSISLNYDEEKSAIVCSVENEIPFLAGTLNLPVQSVSSSVNDNVYTISLKKVDEKQKWEIVIKDFVPDSDIIDPNSAFLLGSKGNSERFLDEAIKMRYVKAVIFKTKESMSNDAFWDVVKSVYEKYDDNEIEMILGYHELYLKNYHKAYEYFEKSSNRGNLEATAALVEIMSPYVMPVVPDLIDPERALSLLLDLYEKDKQNPYVCFILSPFYQNGKYIEKDEEKARELYNFAVNKTPELSSIGFIDENEDIIDDENDHINQVNEQPRNNNKKPGKSSIITHYVLPSLAIIGVVSLFVFHRIHNKKRK